MLRSAFFVEPTEPLRSRLTDIMHTLADQYGTAVFEPHVTFYTDFYPTEEAILQVFRAVTKMAACFSLQPKTVAYTDVFTRSLFLDFEDAPGLRHLYEQTKISTECVVSYVYRPHLSLMYTAMSAQDKQILAQNLHLPPGPYAFDHCGVAVTVDKPVCKTDIEQWRLLAEAPLSA